MITVLYVTFASTNYDGATYSLLDLINSVKGQVHPIVLLRSKGCVYDLFQTNGIECIVHDFVENISVIPQRFRTFAHNCISWLPHYMRYKTLNRRCVQDLTELLKNRHIDIIHTNNTVLTIGYHLSKTLQAKHVWHLRGFMDLDLGWRPFMGWADMRKKLHDSDAVIGITQAVLYHYVDSNEKNAVAIFDAIRCKNEAIVVEKQKYFLFCSVFLTQGKGYDFAIEAFAASKLYLQGYRLKMIGRAVGIEQQKCVDLVNRLNLSDYIDFIESTDDVRSYMLHATAFLMCSKNEGLGRVTVESMYYGCPVIGRNSGGTVELIKDGITGYLFEDVEDCACKMQYVVTHDNSKLIHDAQQFAVENFAIENYGNKIVDVYNSILK